MEQIYLALRQIQLQPETQQIAIYSKYLKMFYQEVRYNLQALQFFQKQKVITEFFSSYMYTEVELTNKIQIIKIINAVLQPLFLIEPLSIENQNAIQDIIKQILDENFLQQLVNTILELLENADNQKNMIAQYQQQIKDIKEELYNLRQGQKVPQQSPIQQQQQTQQNASVISGSESSSSDDNIIIERVYNVDDIRQLSSKIAQRQEKLLNLNDTYRISIDGINQTLLLIFYCTCDISGIYVTQFESFDIFAIYEQIILLNEPDLLQYQLLVWIQLNQINLQDKFQLELNQQRKQAVLHTDQIIPANVYISKEIREQLTKMQKNLLLQSGLNKEKPIQMFTPDIEPNRLLLTLKKPIKRINKYDSDSVLKPKQKKTITIDQLQFQFEFQRILEGRIMQQNKIELNIESQTVFLNQIKSYKLDILVNQLSKQFFTISKAYNLDISEYQIQIAIKQLLFSCNYGNIEQLNQQDSIISVLTYLEQVVLDLLASQENKQYEYVYFSLYNQIIMFIYNFTIQLSKLCQNYNNCVKNYNTNIKLKLSLEQMIKNKEMMDKLKWDENIQKQKIEQVQSKILQYLQQKETQNKTIQLFLNSLLTSQFLYFISYINKNWVYQGSQSIKQLSILYNTIVNIQIAVSMVANKNGQLKLQFIVQKQDKNTENQDDKDYNSFSVKDFQSDEDSEQFIDKYVSKYTSIGQYILDKDTIYKFLIYCLQQLTVANRYKMFKENYKMMIDLLQHADEQWDIIIKPLQNIKCILLLKEIRISTFYDNSLSDLSKFVQIAFNKINNQFGQHNQMHLNMLRLFYPSQLEVKFLLEQMEDNEKALIYTQIEEDELDRSRRKSATAIMSPQQMSPDKNQQLSPISPQSQNIQLDQQINIQNPFQATQQMENNLIVDDQISISDDFENMQKIPFTIEDDIKILDVYKKQIARPDYNTTDQIILQSEFNIALGMVYPYQTVLKRAQQLYQQQGSINDYNLSDDI